MKPLSIGHSLDARPFHIPANIVTKTVAILGLRGSGKSNTAAIIVEEMLDQNLPPVIIDPTDAWWGLRSKYPVFIFGGSHGDVPLQETDGKTIAEFIVNEKVPVVLSLRHLRKGAQRRFVMEFCEELYHLKGKDENRTSLTVVIDEAPLFVPQKVMGETARVVGAVEDLIARGRNAGFGVLLISQRSATINKDVLTQSDVILTHRLTSPQDKAALGEWFEDNASTDKQKEIIGSLASLPDGRAWIWAPTLKIMEQVQIRRRHTFDSSATPELGKAIVAPKKLTEVNLDILKEKMAATLEKAKSEDPKILKAQISSLQKQIEQESMKPKEVKIEKVVVPAVPEKVLDEIAGLRASANELASKSDLLYRKAMDIERAVQSVASSIANQADKSAHPLFPLTDRLHHPKAPRSIPVPAGGTTHEGTTLGKCALALLTVMVQFHPNPVPKSRLALVSGYSVNSSSFSNGCTELRTKGLAVGSSEFTPTSDGMAVIGSNFVPFPEGDAAISYWISRLDKCPASLLSAIQFAGGRLARSALAEQSGYSETSSSFSNGLTELRTLGIIQTDRENAWIHPDLTQ